MEEERILVSTLDRVAADVRAQGFEPPAIVVIGDIVALRERLLATPAGTVSR
jgi:uroporphyrin-III C-methyltransferase